MGAIEDMNRDQTVNDPDANGGMTSRERMRAVMTGRLPDRVPFFPTIYTDHACLASDRRFEEALIDPALGAECMLKAALRYQADAVRFTMAPPDSWFAQKEVVEKGTLLVQRDRASGREEGIIDVAGGGAFVPHEKPAPVKTLQEARAIRVTTCREYLEQGCLKNVARLAAEAHRQGLFVVGMCPGQTLNFMVEKMGGAEAALLSFYDEPDLARALIEKAVVKSIEAGRAFAAAGVDCLYMGDSYTSGSVISAELYEQFCASAYREVAREFHRLGVFCYKHCCGNYNPLLEGLVTVGVDAMDGIDPTSGMSVRHTKACIGDKLTLMGGLSCLTLLNGTTDQVYAEARQCVEEGKPGGRYVLGSACAVPRHTPPENLIAARQATINHGRYTTGEDRHDH
jgi:uroporphyrinogen-III decarboxylase